MRLGRTRGKDGGGQITTHLDHISYCKQHLVQIGRMVDISSIYRKNLSGRDWGVPEARMVVASLVWDMPFTATAADSNKIERTRKVDIRLPGKGNSNSHGARPVHLIISMMKWIRTSRLSIKSLPLGAYPRRGWWCVPL